VTVGPVIAVDARLVGYAAGIARYALLLSRALAATTHGDEQYVILRGRRARGHPLGGPAMRTKLCMTPPHHPLERWTLPLEVLPTRASLLHSVDHVTPRWGPWRRVVTIHDLAFLLYPNTHTHASRAYYAAAGESARRAERVIAVSQRTASDAVRLLGVDPVRVRVVHEAAAPAFAPRPRAELELLAQQYGFEAQRPYVLFVGTLEPRKNVNVLFEVLARVRRELDVQLLLAGARGWLDEPIFAAHAASGVGEAARFLGPVSETALAVLYSHAGVFALPSLYEGFGLPVLEAMACGAPVVCSNTGPLPEVAHDAALLLKPDDATAWAQALARVLTDQVLANDLRARGFRRAAQFTWAQTARATRDVYREALLA
jgi:glycosyltransferase involved in cell wall biosynthesis